MENFETFEERVRRLEEDIEKKMMGLLFALDRSSVTHTDDDNYGIIWDIIHRDHLEKPKAMEKAREWERVRHKIFDEIKDFHDNVLKK